MGQFHSAVSLGNSPQYILEPGYKLRAGHDIHFGEGE